MVALQILSKVLQTSDDSIIVDNMLTKEHFLGYEEEFDFIDEHKQKYGNIPDKETFLARFPNFEILEVNEPDRYLLDTIKEEYLYAVAVPIVNKFAELLKSDANEATEYLESQRSKLNPNYYVGGTDIIHEADSRREEHEARSKNQKDWYFESGFPELDEIIHGIQRGEEFMVIVARLGQGKSWILAKICTHIWKTGFNVGYISPEMSANMIGFRFDTLNNNFSNKNLMYGNEETEYDEYIDGLKDKKNKFIVATPADFDHRITVSKLRNWVKQYDLHLIAIDGIKYLSDERGHRNDNATTSLTNISEDLMELSVELRVPVIVVVQANRGGASSADDDGTPELENIRDSDGIGHCASKVISIKQKTDGVLEMGIKKNRFGAMGGRLNYTWDIDTGEFTFLQAIEKSKSRRTGNPTESKEKRKDNTSVF